MCLLLSHVLTHDPRLIVWGFHQNVRHSQSLYQNLSNSKSDYFDTQFVTFMLRSDLVLDKVIISIRDLFVRYGIKINDRGRSVSRFCIHWRKTK